MPLKLIRARSSDAPAIAALETRVAEDLTAQFGKGHWSGVTTEKGVLYHMRHGMVLVAMHRGKPIATLRLVTKKPWAIDVKYFTKCTKSLYLLNMAVDPRLQRQGIGRACIEAAQHAARDWPSDAIRLDAYDAEAGAGGFYAKCGFREVGRVVYRNTPLVYYEMLL